MAALKLFRSLAVFGLLTSTARAVSSPEIHQILRSRTETCPSSNPSSCLTTDSKLPGDFCCGSESSCISIDSSSSAICCPQGRDCSTISVVPCDVSLQDGKTNNGNLYTTNLSGRLPRCGSQCCPFGYECVTQPGNDPVCSLIKGKAIFPKDVSSPSSVSTTLSTSSTRSSSTSSTSTSATRTASPTTATAAASSGLDSTQSHEKAACDRFPAGVFLAGLFPGIVLGALAVLAWVVLTGRHHEPNKRDSVGSTYKGGKAYISEPIPFGDNRSERSDFLTRTRSRAKTMFSSRSAAGSEAASAHPKMPTPPANHFIPAEFMSRMDDVPVTPERRVARYPSAADEDMNSSNDADPNHETIRIYSPTNIAHPSASVPPLRAMQSQRRSNSGTNAETTAEPYQDPYRKRRDSGTGGFSFGSPFQTPEKSRSANHDLHTYHQEATVPAPPAVPSLYPLPPPTTVAATQHAHPHPKPHHNPDPDRLQVLTPARYQAPKPAAKTYAPRPDTEFELDGDEVDDGGKTRPTTNATTFTAMLRSAGIPDPGRQAPQIPPIPKNVNHNGTSRMI